MIDREVRVKGKTEPTQPEVKEELKPSGSSVTTTTITTTTRRVL